MTKRHANGFTLIEMLTVLAIIGIILAATLPAVTHLMKSTGLNVASREVANTLGLARQLAITQRVYARVVFPYSDTGSEQDMWYRTYAVMTNQSNTATANWRYASKWEYLPVGVVFLDSNPLGMASGATPLPAGSGALDDSEPPAAPIHSLRREGNLSFPIPGNAANVGTFSYIEFVPTGAATPFSSTIGPSVLTITEGFVTSGSMPTPTSKNTANTLLVNVGTITVNSLVGHIQVTRP